MQKKAASWLAAGRHGRSPCGEGQRDGPEYGAAAAEGRWAGAVCVAGGLPCALVMMPVWCLTLLKEHALLYRLSLEDPQGG